MTALRKESDIPIAVKGSHYVIRSDRPHLPERRTGTFWVEVKDSRLIGVTTSAPVNVDVVDLTGRVVMMTIATELPGALEMADYLREHGCTVSIGHSAAPVEQAGEAFGHGINVLTHYFNARSGLEFWEVGLLCLSSLGYRVRAVHP